MAQATTSAQTTHCPGCGAKIPATVSICPYCVTPIQTGGGKTGDQEANPVVERLQRMMEKPEFEQGRAWTPLEGPLHRKAMSRGRRGAALAVVGLVLIATELAAESSDALLLLRPWFLVGLAFVLVGGTAAVRALQLRRRTLALPLLKRAARVADRRSETAIVGGTGETTYYFELEFEDDSRAEFSYPGRGASEDVLTSGVTGIAYTRGQELLAFKRIRV